MRLRRPLPTPDHRVSWWPGAEMRIRQALPAPEAGPARILLRTLLTEHPPVMSVRQLAERYHIHDKTLAARWSRAGLGSLSDWLDEARLIRVAFLLDDETNTIAVASAALRFPFPESFRRHVLLRTGLLPRAWRESVTGSGLLDAFIARIEQHAEALTTIDLQAPYAAAYPTRRRELTAGAA